MAKSRADLLRFIEHWEEVDSYPVIEYFSLQTANELAVEGLLEVVEAPDGMDVYRITEVGRAAVTELS